MEALRNLSAPLRRTPSFGSQRRPAGTTGPAGATGIPLSDKGPGWSSAWATDGRQRSARAHPPIGAAMNSGAASHGSHTAAVPDARVCPGVTSWRIRGVCDALLDGASMAGQILAVGVGSNARGPIQWPRRGSNPHGDRSPRDFKSRASASFATRPEFPRSYHQRARAGSGLPCTVMEDRLQPVLLPGAHRLRAPHIPSPDARCAHPGLHSLGCACAAQSMATLVTYAVERDTGSPKPPQLLGAKNFRLRMRADTPLLPSGATRP